MNRFCSYLWVVVLIPHVKKRAKAKKALTRLRTIANKLIRELQRKIPTHSLFETYQKDCQQ
jgi:IS5 family transposase